jgi:RHS repeat-associated protein
VRRNVADTVNAAEGFKDGNVGSDDYIYDANGNMVTDKNKDIASITYNHLNLPSQVTKTGGEHINYIYNAGGIKMSQEVYDASNALMKKTDYLGEYFYENDTLRFINHEEGRIITAGGTPEYQYMLKDHLGNNRITFTSKEQVDTFAASLEDGTQTEEQAAFGNYNSVTNDLMDYTDAGTVYDKVLVLNGGISGQIGLTKSFAVVPGDVISASVYAKYLDASSTSSNVANMATALTEAFGLSPAMPGEAAGAFEALSAFGSLLATGDRDVDDENAPMGFINILVFDKDYNLIDFAFQQIDASYVQSGGTKAFYDPLTVASTIRLPGYAYVFLSNEGVMQQEIAFDEYSISHAHGAVIQQDEYYPFGLTFNSYQRENSLQNRFKFQGQEHIDDLNLGWDSFKWRNHQPDIGRFFNADPLAEKYYYNSPYAFSENDVVSSVELEGLESYRVTNYSLIQSNKITQNIRQKEKIIQSPIDRNNMVESANQKFEQISERSAEIRRIVSFGVEKGFGDKFMTDQLHASGIEVPGVVESGKSTTTVEVMDPEAQFSVELYGLLKDNDGGLKVDKLGELNTGREMDQVAEKLGKDVAVKTAVFLIDLLGTLVVPQTAPFFPGIVTEGDENPVLH